MPACTRSSPRQAPSSSRVKRVARFIGSSSLAFRSARVVVYAMSLAERIRPASGDPEGALVLFHGRGADENDLYPLLDLLDPDRRLLGATARGPLSLPPGGAGGLLAGRRDVVRARPGRGPAAAGRDHGAEQPHPHGGRLRARRRDRAAGGDRPRRVRPGHRRGVRARGARPAERGGRGRDLPRVADAARDQPGVPARAAGLGQRFRRSARLIRSSSARNTRLIRSKSAPNTSEMPPTGLARGAGGAVGEGPAAVGEAATGVPSGPAAGAPPPRAAASGGASAVSILFCRQSENSRSSRFDTSWIIPPRPKRARRPVIVKS